MGLHHYWPSQYYSRWNFKEGTFDTSLNERRPWYSLPSNELVDTNYTDPWGHGLARSIRAEHILGLRQYELTNQTQNVMAVVLDKRFIKTTGNGNRDRFMASISAAYDYYPYGMLMPGRTTADTSLHCMTVMKEFKSATPFPKAADMGTAVATLGGSFTAPPGGGFTGGTVVYGKSGGLKLDLSVKPGEAIDIRSDISWIAGFGVTVTVTEIGASGVKKMLGSKTISYPGMVTLPVRPSVNKVTLAIDNISSFATAPTMGLFSVAAVSYDSLAYWSQWAPVTICDKNTDKYPFGFNGQMKSNDVAGIGNFNTAEFWEYNTRTGRRLNLDPRPNVSRSGYAAFSGNPVWLMDIKGDTPSYTPPAMINPDPAERFFTWLLMDATPALKPVQALENYGKRNWYVERDSHYGPLGFKYNGWPMWKAIWGTGGAILTGGALYADYTALNTFHRIIGFTELTTSTYSAASDIKQTATGTGLPGSQYTDQFNFMLNLRGFSNFILKGSTKLDNFNNAAGATMFLTDQFLNLGSKDKDSKPQGKTTNTNNLRFNAITGKME